MSGFFLKPDATLMRYHLVLFSIVHFNNLVLYGIWYKELAADQKDAFLVILLDSRFLGRRSPIMEKRLTVRCFNPWEMVLNRKAAIKKLAMLASREFLAELKVHLIGYCVEGSLFLVYEYIENGNLSELLRGSGNEPLPWSTRVQIALESARGLEYIHEHTVPVYIHHDIKSANILIDKNFHGKVADFGLARLTEVRVSLPTRLVGTFGYMPPE
ncbi:hypothetical protein RHSIM_Rhsim06G0134800 [Rhododendron simsii]|uniref:Protein kinase domain-containing protein n=1 Tax=Rhododendron simsii TaxID=118357 RepID=A0A834GQ27_RHOSS|nr:hypothetical protein RHSIM_Rhsim06G0134800 [Rhododendron simsii]